MNTVEGVVPHTRRWMMARDPVCGMSVEESKAAATSVYEGRTYHFCSAACKTRFDKEPSKYAKR
jgi:YHS domain-containing protein